MKIKIEKSSIMAFILIVFIILVSFPGFSFTPGSSNKSKEVAISSWLKLGPFPALLPAFHQDKRKEFTIKDLLLFKEIEASTFEPKAGDSLQWFDGTLGHWQKIQSETEEIKINPIANRPSIVYLGVYLEVKRWTKASLILKSPQLFEAFIDGKQVSSKDKADITPENESSMQGKMTSADLKLETGKHFLLIKSVYDPSSNSSWSLRAILSLQEKFSFPSFSLYPQQTMNISHLLDGPQIAGASISPDGTWAALSIRQSSPPSDKYETWLEMYRLPQGDLVRTYRGSPSISRINWAPDSKKFSYTSRTKEGGTIWIVDLKKGTTLPLLKNIKNLGSHVWSPDSKFIIYSLTEKGQPDRPGVKRFKNLADRQPWWRDRSYLYRIDVNSGLRQRLTAGRLSTNFNSISPDGLKILFTRSLIDYSERPYSKTELYSLDLNTLKTTLLWKGKWFNSAQWGPQGKKILILGGPSTFGAIGRNVPDDMIPNEYDTQAFIFDPQTKKVEAISKNFDPALNQAFWKTSEKNIYFIATDRSYRHLFKYDLIKKKYFMIDCGVEVVESLDMAKNSPTAVFTGSSASIPAKAFIINLQNNKYRLLHDPGAKKFADVKFGKVERWTFKNKRGTEIEGRIYYPANFDPSQKYPCLVYYYGGTSPVTREFGGRYPKNLYAAQGYIVYVPQPSGAVGFGQKFSALHVNDWGIIVADEIIDGVKKFLAAHSFVDSKRVGCMGASYGGFMTMLLLTRTDIFAAAVAHAGISSISSYWGQGYWGYAYNAISAANSFPWNRKDIYVNQSALFKADKITTPLLLLHGSVDTNVPPGESTQLFTALKILGRRVEYIQIFDQNHHIMTYNKRKIWTKTIMAWFDKWLKRQAEWWNELYPSQ